MPLTSEQFPQGTEVVISKSTIDPNLIGQHATVLSPPTDGRNVVRVRTESARTIRYTEDDIANGFLALQNQPTAAASSDFDMPVSAAAEPQDTNVTFDFDEEPTRGQLVADVLVAAAQLLLTVAALVDSD